MGIESGEWIISKEETEDSEIFSNELKKLGNIL